MEPPPVKLVLALAAALALSAAAQAQPAAPSPSDVTTLPGVTVEAKPALPSQPCRPTDRACYAVVAQQLKTQYPDVYWKLALKCMAEEQQEMRMHANPLIDGSASDDQPTSPGGSGRVGDIGTQSRGEKTFCAIAQSDAKPPPKSAKR
jgi:hypothetical protein